MKVAASTMSLASPKPIQKKKAASNDNAHGIAELLMKASEGDKHAFHEIYRKTFRSIYAVVRSVVNDEAIAEDVTQEVYATIWRRASSFKSQKGNPLAWMTAIARNRAIDQLRAQRSRSFVSYTDELPDMAAEGASADLSADAQVIRKVLDDLRPEFRDALLLTYVQGYSRSELAEKLNVPEGTAKSWVRRGLAAVKEVLEAK